MLELLPSTAVLVTEARCNGASGVLRFSPEPQPDDVLVVKNFSSNCMYPVHGSIEWDSSDVLFWMRSNDPCLGPDTAWCASCLRFSVDWLITRLICDHPFWLQERKACDA